MPARKPEPLLNTPMDQIGKPEKVKLESDMARGELHQQFRDQHDAAIDGAAETLAKSHGIYLEYNRATTGKEKDWMYMVRITVPGGGPFNAAQWRIIDDIATEYTANADGRPSIRLTTRQNVQFHWVHKPDVVRLVQRVAETGFFSLNGCGDNTRNVMACPLSRFSGLFDGHALAHEIGAYFRLPAEAHIQVFEIDTSLIRTPDEHFSYGPMLLNRKFKIAISAVHPDGEGGFVADNCVELRTNEIGIAPIVENGAVDAFQVYIGGGQGEKNGKPTFAALGRPFGVFTRDNLMKGLDAIVATHQEWGDRKNRHWARLKYVVNAQGIPWFQDRVRERGGVFEQPLPDFDPGKRNLHHGWTQQPTDGLWARGVYIENGRLIDRPNESLKAMVMRTMERFPDATLFITPNQDLLFTGLPEEARDAFDAHLTEFGHGQRRGKAYSTLRVLSGACVGLDTCRLAYTESEQFEPELLDQMEDRGYGDVTESIGITGCERQCFRPATKTVGWVGQGPDLYGLKVGGSEDGSTQGQWLVDEDRWYLRQTPRDRVADVTQALFEFHRRERASEAESMGACINRLGPAAVVAALKADPTTADLMEKTHEAPFQLLDADAG